MLPTCSWSLFIFPMGWYGYKYLKCLKTEEIPDLVCEKMLTDICEDDTDCIIIYVWHQNVKLLNDKFKVGSAYMLQNATVNICKPRFAIKPKKLCLSLDDQSVVLPSNENRGGGGNWLAFLVSYIHTLFIFCAPTQPLSFILGRNRKLQIIPFLYL